MTFKKISLSLLCVVTMCTAYGAGRRVMQSPAQYGDLQTRAAALLNTLEQTYALGQTLAQPQVNEAIVMIESLSDGAPKQANELLIRLLRLQQNASELQIQTITKQNQELVRTHELEIQAALKERDELKASARGMLTNISAFDLALGTIESIVGIVDNLNEKVAALPLNQGLITLSPESTKQLAAITAQAKTLTTRIPGNLRTTVNQIKTNITNIAR